MTENSWKYYNASINGNRTVQEKKHASIKVVTIKNTYYLSQ